jgi:hypothetical protein
MAAEHWFRWHHGTVNDPKWRVVAARACHAMSRTVTIANVIAVWASMLECASQATPRGSLAGWVDEDVAAGLGLEIAEVAAIREAMQGKTTEGDSLSAWNARQPKREDNGAAQRKRDERERKKSQPQDVTGRDKKKGHAPSRNVPLETETEEKEQEEPNGSSSSPAAPATPPVDLAAKRQQREQRLAAVTDEAIATFNASKLVKPNGGRLATVSERVGRETRQAEVKRCIDVARQICREDYNIDRITGEFWNDYWAAVHADDFMSGRQQGGKGHEKWAPDFEFLTRPKTMLKVYDRTASEDVG